MCIHVIITSFVNQIYIICSIKRDDPDYGIIGEELSSSEDEAESNFENLFVCYRRVKNILVMKEPFYYMSRVSESCLLAVQDVGLALITT